jgi:hypothetical protein
MLAFLPLLNELFEVEVKQLETEVVAGAQPLEKPKELLVTAIYEMEEGSKKISGIYIEVFHVGSSSVTYFEVPVDTKVNLSEELYKSLQTYAPELPQYLKLSNMAEGFSAEYGLTGCNRILSEVLGITLSEYVRADKESLDAWRQVLAEEKTAKEFFEAFTDWVETSKSSLTAEERWMYYESRKLVSVVETETAPGSQEKDGYLISGKRSKERLQELMIRRDAELEQVN